MGRGFAVGFFRGWSAAFKAANVTFRPTRRPQSGSDHLGKKIDVIVDFARHVLPNSVQDFEKAWTTIHRFLVVGRYLRFHDLSMNIRAGTLSPSLPIPKTPA